MIDQKNIRRIRRKVVVLIDEYNKAIFDNIGDLNLVDDMRMELNSFYNLFIKGVTKFSKTPIFSWFEQRYRYYSRLSLHLWLNSRRDRILFQ
ncbi:MAG: AAA family ATPase [Methanobrevibacter sp.]|jgi:hypothetical protein|nr:AAA family ATPase [Candidatus Methanovirga aequatorialis]